MQERGSAAEAERDRLATELSAARATITELERRVAGQDESLAAARDDAERRVETERATTTEIHARLATAREAAQRSMIAEAEETEQLRAELARTRDDSERLLAAERAEVARLREEMLSSEVDETAEETSRRMIERITRDLERERATSRNLRRELDELRSDSAEHRRAVSSSTANGTLAMDDPPAAATAAGRASGRAVRTPEGTQRRVAAARVASSQRVPKVPPSPYAIWAVRIGAALLAAAMLITLVVLVSLVT
jgi:chromosome segregation ATPase